MIYKIKKGLVDKLGKVTRISFLGNSKIYVHKDKITLTVVKTKDIVEQLKKQKTIEISVTFDELLIAVKEHSQLIMKNKTNNKIERESRI